jgi:hypothetical protein
VAVFGQYQYIAVSLQIEAIKIFIFFDFVWMPIFFLAPFVASCCDDVGRCYLIILYGVYRFGTIENTFSGNVFHHLRTGLSIAVTCHTANAIYVVVLLLSSENLPSIKMVRSVGRTRRLQFTMRWLRLSSGNH